jgi:hypothetical protein
MASAPRRPELRTHQIGRGVPRSRGVIGRSVQTRSTYTVTPSRDGRATPQPLKEGRDGMTIVEATRSVTGEDLRSKLTRMMEHMDAAGIPVRRDEARSY